MNASQAESAIRRDAVTLSEIIDDQVKQPLGVLMPDATQELASRLCRGIKDARELMLADRTEALSSSESEAIDIADGVLHRAATTSCGRLKPDSIGEQHRKITSTGLIFEDANGKQVEALSYNQPMPRPEGHEADGELSIGRILTCMMTGNRNSLSRAEQLAMHGSDDSAGAYLLEPSLSARLIDLARASSVCMKAGAVTLPMTTSSLDLARIVTDPTSHWRNETVEVTSSEIVFGRVTLMARTLACITPISIELLEDCANAPQLMEKVIRKSMAAEMDRVILRGLGAASEPLGIRNNANVNTVTGVAIPTDYAEISEAIQKILTANYDGDLGDLAWILHPREGETYDGLKGSAEFQPVQRTPWTSKLSEFYTTNVSIVEGSGADESFMIVGHFPSCVVGMRTKGIVLRILDAGTVTDADSDTWNATSQLMRHIVAYLRMDVALLQPTWFTVLEDVTSA